MPMSDYMRGVREKVGTLLLEMPSAAVVTFDERGRVLLVRHAELGVWTVPGGAVEPCEAPADTAVREMWEETGLVVDLVGIRGVYGGSEFVVTYANGDAISFVTVVFEGRRVSGHPRPDGVETLEVGYFAREELDALEIPTWVRTLLDDAFTRSPTPRFHPATWTPPA